MATDARTRAKEETREALIQAGMALFGEQGLDGPSLDAICARAGYTRGAFYVHFADRDDFLVAVMDRVGTELLDRVLGQGDGDLATTVARFVGEVATGDYPLTREGGVRPHQLLDACVRSPKIRARYVALVEDSLSRIAERVARSKATGAVRGDVDDAAAAVILMCAVVGAQTLLELRVPLDVGTASVTLLGLLSPTASPARSTSRRGSSTPSCDAPRRRGRTSKSRTS